MLRFIIYAAVTFSSLLIATDGQQPPSNEYPAGFYRKDNCLFVNIKKLNYRAKIGSKLYDDFFVVGPNNYDPSTNCITPDKPGELVMLFKNPSHQMIKELKIELKFNYASDNSNWHINSGVVHVENNGNWGDNITATKYNLKVDDLYAGPRFSYSCSSLTLKALPQAHGFKFFQITLTRFQIQPFGESTHTIFAPSFDCSVWLTPPLIMGLIFTLFSTFVIYVAVFFLADINTSDLKFSRRVIGAPKS